MGASSSNADTETAVIDAAPADEAAIGVSTRVGRYVVLDEIGRGGMGRVLRAYDPKLQREVALKEVRSRVLGREGAPRLVAEARAMAKLSHPHVVAVYDVEEQDRGHVVLVMEYVAGETLRAWLGRDHSWREIVGRFCDAGRGLAAAHAVGLLHRDFKPANVLVAESGEVKVTDFGLAKPAGGSSRGSSADGAPSRDDAPGLDSLTEVGTILGTPRYMAPEQHQGDTLTAAADQYAYCVALWEALCGAPPFSRQHAAQAKRQGPPRWPEPSTPRPIAEAIRRGLAPDPAARWPSMAALLEALAYDPVRRRNRWLTGLVVVVGVGAAVTGWRTWAAERAARCAPSDARAHLDTAWGPARRGDVEAAVAGIDTAYAAAAWDRVATRLDGYAGEWTRLHVDTCEATTVRGEQSAAVMDLRMACLHRARVQLEAITSVLATADGEAVQKVDELLGGLPPLARCSDIDALSADVEPPLPADAATVERIREHLARELAAERAGRYDEAQAEVDAAEAARSGIAYGPVQTEVALATGRLQYRLGKYDEAQAQLRDALELASRFHQVEPMRDAALTLMSLVGTAEEHVEEAMRYGTLARGLVAGDAESEARLRKTLGTLANKRGDYEEAEKIQRESLAVAEDTYGPDDLHVADVLDSLATILRIRGELDEAEAYGRRVVDIRVREAGSDHPQVARSLNNLAGILMARERWAEAEPLLREAATVFEAALPDHPDVGVLRMSLAITLEAQHRPEEAEAQYRLAEEHRLRTLGPDDPMLARIRTNHAITLSTLGRHAEAESVGRLALASLEARLGPKHPDLAMVLVNLATALKAQEEYEDAAAALERAIALREAAVGPDHVGTAVFHFNLGNTLRALDRERDAEASYRRALRLQLASLPPDHPATAGSHQSLALTLEAQGRIDEALQMAEAAWAVRQGDAAGPEQEGKSAFVLARILWAAGGRANRRRAVTLAERAKTAFAKVDAPTFAYVEDVGGWLETHPPP